MLRWAVCIVHSGLKLLDLSDSPFLASQVVGIENVCHHTCVNFWCNFWRGNWFVQYHKSIHIRRHAVNPIFCPIFCLDLPSAYSRLHTSARASLKGYKQKTSIYYRYWFTICFCHLTIYLRACLSKPRQKEFHHAFSIAWNSIVNLYIIHFKKP
jgi:hypothetical protein